MHAKSQVRARSYFMHDPSLDGDGVTSADRCVATRGAAPSQLVELTLGDRERADRTAMVVWGHPRERRPSQEPSPRLDDNYTMGKVSAPELNGGQCPRSAPSDDDYGLPPHAVNVTALIL